jgi:hypothetical protein
MWSPATIASNPEHVILAATDASGVDRTGGHWRLLSDIDQESYFSQIWDVVPPSSSHAAELTALLHLILRIAPSHPDHLLIWITDSQAASHSVNNVKANREEGRSLLLRIFTLCDLYHIMLVSLWVPREDNTTADFLSHYSAILFRSEVSGKWQSAEELQSLLSS